MAQHRAAHVGGASRPFALLYSGRPETERDAPRTRRSAIALASRIGRPEWRPSDQTKAIRRSVGGSSREMSIRFPGPKGLGSSI